MWMGRIAAACALAAVMIWWIGVWVPERDAHLLAVHDCFIKAGCQASATPESCWAVCSSEVRGRH